MDEFEQGVVAIGAGIVFALILHLILPSGGFFGHLPSGWVALFPVLLVFNRRNVINKTVFGVLYLGIWLIVAHFVTAMGQS